MFDLKFRQITRKLKFWKLVPAWIRHPLSFGQQIYMIRSALGMTQKQLAGRMGTSQKAIVRLEKEEVDPQLSTLKKTALHLNCELLVRFVPRADLAEFVRLKVEQKAENLIRMSASSANIELQKPSSSVLRSEIKNLTDQILAKRRSSLWED